jgi:CHASE2 domain-containing sensor protein
VFRFAAAVAALSVLITAAGASLRFELIRIPLIDSAISAFDDRLSSSQRLEDVLGPAFSRIVLINVTAKDIAATRAASVREADRAQLASLLDALRAAPDRPVAVILDIDVSPTAFDYVEGSSASESRLIQALEAWKADVSAPVLLLARGEDCRLPPGSLRGESEIRVWRSTPYDSVVDPVSPSANIAWTCPIPVVWKDGLVRGLEPLACGARNNDGTGRFAVPGPSTWIREVLTGDGGVASAFARRRDLWQSVCDTPVQSADTLPIPIVAPEDWAEKQVRADWASGSFREPPETLQGALVVIGQTSARAGDRWKMPAIGRMPGFEMIAAGVAASRAGQGKLTLNPVTGSLVGGLFGFALSFAYFVIRAVRKRLSEAADLRLGRMGGFLVRLVLAPPIIVALTSLCLLFFLPYAMAVVFSPQSWIYICCAAAGSSLALMLADFAMIDDPGQK